MKREQLTAVAVVVVAGLAVSGCSSRPAPRSSGTGSPIAEPGRRLVLEPGSPAMASDGTVYREDRRAMVEAPVPVVRRDPPAGGGEAVRGGASGGVASGAGAGGGRAGGREAVIDLEGEVGSGAAARPEAARPEAGRAETVPAREVTRGETAKPPAREPKIDLTEPEVLPGASGAGGNQAGTERPQGGVSVRGGEPTAAAEASSASVPEMVERAVATILQASRSEDPTVRANAIEVAGLDPVRFESVIAAGLSDRNEGVQAVAAMTVGKKQIRGLAGRLRSLLSSPSAYVETAAVMGLLRCGEAVEDGKVSRIAQILWTTESPKLRSHAAFLLGEIGDKSALPMLKQAAGMRMPRASQSEMNLMLLQFSEAMVKLGDTEQIETIRAMLHPSRPEDLEASALAAQILGELGDRRPIDQLVFLSAYKQPNTGQMYPAEVRMQIASSLAKLGLDRGGFIADEYAASPDPILRVQAATVYGDTRRPEHLPKLAKLATDPLEQVRVAAAYGVLKIAGVGGNAGR